MNRSLTIKLTAAIATSLCSTVASAQLTNPPPICDAYPPDASQAMKDCYDAACEIFQKAYANCETATCRAAARLEYGLALGDCHLNVSAPIHADRSSWVTLVYRDGQWSYSFEESTPSDAIVFRF